MVRRVSSAMTAADVRFSTLSFLKMCPTCLQMVPVFAQVRMALMAVVGFYFIIGLTKPDLAAPLFSPRSISIFPPPTWPRRAS